MQAQRLTACLTLLSAVVWGCASGGFRAARDGPEQAFPDVGSAGVVAAEAAGAGESLPPPESPPVLVRNADLTIRVPVVEEAIRRIRALAEQAGGFVLSSRLDAITVKVPSGKLDDVVERIADLGELTHRSIQAREVTAEFYDLEARLRNTRATRDKLHELLQKAGTVQETLQVYRELGGVQELLERLEGRLRMLRAQTTLSEVRIQVTLKRTPGPVLWVFMGVDWLLGKLFFW
ncbi:MAG: DUF4349 domain-containing protein [Planctomycetes bacterium]|nr:DUF4349 domain-containing protein [Planctomycetota bacterium]